MLVIVNSMHYMQMNPDAEKGDSKVSLNLTIENIALDTARVVYAQLRKKDIAVSAGLFKYVLE